MYVHIEANNFKFGTAQCSVVYRWIAGLKVGRWQEGLGTLNFRDIILPRLIACIVLPPCCSAFRSHRYRRHFLELAAQKSRRRAD